MSATGAEPDTVESHELGAHDRPDEGRMRRRASIAIGVVLVLDGLRRRSLFGGLELLVGGAMLYRTVRDDRSAVDTDAEARGVSRAAVTVARPAEDLSTFVRNPRHLEEALGPFVDVEPTGSDRLRITLEPPVGPGISWEMELVEARTGERLRWTAVGGTVIVREIRMQLQPAPGDRGTELTMAVHLDPPGGRYGAAALRRIGVIPDSLVRVTLDRMKSLAETGEIPTTSHSPSGRGRGDYL